MQLSCKRLARVCVNDVVCAIGATIARNDTARLDPKTNQHDYMAIATGVSTQRMQLTHLGPSFDKVRMLGKVHCCVVYVAVSCIDRRLAYNPCQPTANSNSMLGIARTIALKKIEITTKKM